MNVNQICIVHKMIAGHTMRLRLIGSKGSRKGPLDNGEAFATVDDLTELSMVLF